MIKLFGLVGMASLFLAGCGSDETVKKEELKSVEFYSNNDVERKAKVEYCNNYPSKQADDPNCASALDANAKRKMKQLMNEGIKIDYSEAEKKHTK